jgi:hypothetical protein
MAESPESRPHRVMAVLIMLSIFCLVYFLHVERVVEPAQMEQIKKRFDFKNEALVPAAENTAGVINASDSDSGSGNMVDNGRDDDITSSGSGSDHNNEENNMIYTNNASSSTAKSSNNGECNLDCDALNSKRIDEFGGDLMDRTVLLQLATQAREKVVENIKKDYGIYFEDIFKNGFEPITHDGDSIQTLRRKLKIKALTVQSNNVLKETELCDQECRLLEHDASSPIYNSTIPHYTQYVWATGGHSASAGHGNLFNESSTAFMERDIKPIFAATGIEFEGRNYAMGGTTSGLEISMCFDQVFGSDVDFFSWDYGMIDGRKDSLLFHYGYRGALNPGRPAIVGVWTDGWKGVNDRLRDFESLGVAAFHRPKENTRAMHNAFPDSGYKTEEELAAMPDYVRHFKCQGKIEKGEPHCQEEKYTKGLCDHRAGKANWHPGFKQHGLDGHMLALFLSQIFVDALQDLVDHPNQDPVTLLAELKTEEDDLMEQFLKADLPEAASKLYDAKKDRDPDVDFNVLYKGPSICHIARTPAMTRYLGYLTNTEKVGGIAPFGNETYDTGIEKGEADTTEDARGELRLVWENNPKVRQFCEFQIRPDYKDYFYAHQRDGLVSLVFPNEKEKVAYNYDQSKMKGLIIIVLAICDWQECADGDLKADSMIANGDVTITVNGKQVSSIADIGNGGLLLKHENGVHFEPSASEDYEIAVEVQTADSFLRVSSIIVY